MKASLPVMDQEFRRKVVDDLLKSGFSSEIRALRSFRHSGQWGFRAGETYYDLDEHKTRQIDFSAYHPFGSTKGGPIPSACFVVVAEVKKSERPWVVFPDRRDLVRAWIERRSDLLFHTPLPNDATDYRELMWRHSPLFSSGWQGHNVHESFKNPTDYSRWHSAAVSVAKASEDQLAWGSGAPDEINERKTSEAKSGTSAPYLLHVQPLIVLDGPLLAAVMDEAGELQIGELAGAPMRFHFRTPSYHRHFYQIDLVALQYLSEYVRQLEQQHINILKALLRATGADAAVIDGFCTEQREFAERAWGTTEPAELNFPLPGKP